MSTLDGYASVIVDGIEEIELGTGFARLYCTETRRGRPEPTIELVVPYAAVDAMFARIVGAMQGKKKPS